MAPIGEQEMQTTLLREMGHDILLASIFRIHEFDQDDRHKAEGTVCLVVKAAMAANPTQHLGFTEWLLKRWLRHEITLSDIRAGRPILERFVANIRYLPASKWNIHQYSSLLDVQLACDEHLRCTVCQPSTACH